MATIEPCGNVMPDYYKHDCTLCENSGLRETCKDNNDTEFIFCSCAIGLELSRLCAKSEFMKVIDLGQQSNRMKKAITNVDAKAEYTYKQTCNSLLQEHDDVQLNYNIAIDKVNNLESDLMALATSTELISIKQFTELREQYIDSVRVGRRLLQEQADTLGHFMQYSGMRPEEYRSSL